MEYSALTRFFEQLMQKDSPEYCSFSPCIGRLLIQLGLDHLYGPEKIIQAAYMRMKNTEESDTPIRSLPMYVRRACLTILRELKQLHSDENLTVLSGGKTPDSFHDTLPLIDVKREVKVLYLALASISERDRHLIYLRHICGLSLNEMRQALGNSETLQTLQIEDIASLGERALHNLRLAYTEVDGGNSE